MRPCGLSVTAVGLACARCVTGCAFPVDMKRCVPPCRVLHRAAPWPIPPRLQPCYNYWLAGPRKRYMLLQPDEVVQRCVQLLDA